MVANGSQPQTIMGTSIRKPWSASSCARLLRASSEFRFWSFCTSGGCVYQYASAELSTGRPFAKRFTSSGGGAAVGTLDPGADGGRGMLMRVMGGAAGGVGSDGVPGSRTVTRNCRAPEVCPGASCTSIWKWGESPAWPRYPASAEANCCAKEFVDSAGEALEKENNGAELVLGAPFGEITMAECLRETGGTSQANRKVTAPAVYPE